MVTRLHLGSNNSVSDKILGEQNAIDDPNYVRKSETIIVNALKKGYDVLQFVNGNLITTELKVLILQHNWNKENGKFERAKSAGARNKKNRVRSNNNKKRFDNQFIKDLDSGQNENQSKDITNKEQLEDADVV